MAGWRSTVTGDYFTTLDDETFTMVPGAKPAFYTGMRVEFSKAVDFYPSDYIDARERGIVSQVDHESGVVYVLLEGLHMGLGDNTLTLKPHDDEIALAAIEPLKRSMLRRSGPAKLGWGQWFSLVILRVVQRG